MDSWSGCCVIDYGSLPSLVFGIWHHDIMSSWHLVFHAFRLSPLAPPFAFRLSPFAFRLSPVACRLSPFAFRLSPFVFRLPSLRTEQYTTRICHVLFASNVKTKVYVRKRSDTFGMTTKQEIFKKTYVAIIYIVHVHAELSPLNLWPI